MVDDIDYLNDPSVDEYKALASTDDIVEGFNAIEPNSYEEFLSAAQHALKNAIAIIEQSANRFYYQGEEELNSFVAGLLVGQSIEATTEENNRGNVDIIVSDENYKWLIEAKLGKTNNYIFEGLLQILTRYATKETDFGLLVYFQNKKPAERYSKWQTFIDKGEWIKYAKKYDIYDEVLDYIPNANWEQLLGDRDLASQRQMITSHGTKINIQLFGVDLYHNPLDKSGRDGAGQAFFHAKQAAQTEYLKYRDDEDFDIDKLMKSLGTIFKHSKEFDSLDKD
ncbi:hypothetical protein [Vibrio sp. 99K-1]|uniref:hypothetical protein n=1 Tax=Vibrio sp. 99K-1 TaxID=2607603 RepID=UPI001493D0E5|nr:hypothetical protein [Vibrio sp. 99K-1]NOI88441.1 hypothetical protein [Vibrio sp. 99K-1]